MKGVNILISFLDLLYIMLILAYGKATDFYKLVLYPDLLKVFISFEFPDRVYRSFYVSSHVVCKER